MRMIRSPNVLPFLHALEKYVLGSLIIAITIIVFLGVITRYVFGFSFYWIEEIPRYCLVWVTFFGAVSLMKKGIDHPRVLKLISSLPDPLQKYLLIGENIVMMLIMAVMCIGSLVMIRIHHTQVSPAMEMPMYIVYSIIPLSALIGLLRLGVNICDIAKGGMAAESRFD